MQYATAEINEIIKQFLAAIAGFQLKLKERDPLNFNKKRRYVLGMKQCINSIKSGRAKIIFLAPDSEASDILNDVLSNLFDEANTRGVPIIYCLSRRLLAKSLGISMRQVAIAVFDADGAYDMFKAIRTFLTDDDNNNT